MSIGDFLSGAVDWAERFYGSLNINPSLLGQKAEHPVNIPKGENPITTVTNAAFKPLGVAFEPVLATRELPVVGGVVGDTIGGVMTVLDTGRRAIDSAIITGQYADYKGRNTALKSDWSEFLNKDTWNKAWQQSSLDNGRRVTGGQAFWGNVNDVNDAADANPFDPAGIKKLQDSASSTAFGSTMTVMQDLGESFVSPPGFGVAARARAASGLKSSAETVEQTARRFNEAGVPERGLGQKAAAAAKDALTLSVPNGAGNIDSIVARTSKGLRMFDGMTDEYAVHYALEHRLPTAPSGDIAKVANTFVQIERLHAADPALRERLRINTFLASQASPTAKAALIRDAPLIAANFEGLTTLPRQAGVFTDLAAARFSGKDVSINEVLASHYDTAADATKREALKEHVARLKTAKKDSARAIGELNAIRPRVQATPEAMHVQGKREELHIEARKAAGEVRQARKDLHGTKRWAAGAARDAQGVGATTDVVDFNQAIGDARRRLEDATSRHQQIVSDRTLLDQTPLHDPTALDEWRSQMDEKQLERVGIGSELDAVKAEKKALNDTIKAKQAEIAGIAPLLDEANSRISDILDIAGPDSNMALTGDAKVTVLARLKDHMRSQIGIDHLVTVGEGNTPVILHSLPTEKMRQALAPRARGSISMTEVGLGARQLEDVMLRSKVFSTDEIAATRSDLIRSDAGTRHRVVSNLQDKMYSRMVEEFLAKRMPELTPEERLAYADETLKLTRKGWAEGNEWLAKAVREQADSPQVHVYDIDGTLHGFDGPTLRSQMANGAPILDPWNIKHDLQMHGGALVKALRSGGDIASSGHHLLVQTWKQSAILRPGLFVRTQLDNGVRAAASLSAAEQMVAMMSGSTNFVHNRALKGVSKVKYANLPPDVLAAKLRFSGTKVLSAGGHKWQLAEDQVGVSANLFAGSKGSTVHQSLNHDMNRAFDQMTLDNNSWKRLDPNSATWHLGYREYATQMLNSPTIRMVADLKFKPTAGEDIVALRERIKDSPTFTREYRVLAQKEMSRSQWLDLIIDQVDLMFPNEKMLNAAKNMGLSQKLIDREIPRAARFKIPSPEESVFVRSNPAVQKAKKAVDGMWRLMLDKPDMWLNRNPVMTSLYQRNVKREVAAVARSRGEAYRLTDREKELIHERAKNQAISHVRRTFFDTSRNTNLNEWVANISPFIAAWEDAMVSWGRLIHDDPRRLTKLVAAFHSPFTISTSTGNPLVVDENGQPIDRSHGTNNAFVEIPAGMASGVATALGPALKVFGLDVEPNGLGKVRVRLDSGNTVNQGGTWWLPGVGPSVTVPLTFVLGSGKVVSREAALDLVDTKNPMGQAILNSVYLDGEIPQSDAKSLAMSATPGWIRTAFTQYYGEGKIRTQTYAFNQLVMEAQTSGKTLSKSDYDAIRVRAEKMANAAATVRFAMSAGLGFSGSATVDAQFYVDQMHIIQAMPPEMRVDKQGTQLSPEEFFAQEYPDAADLDWGVTKNTTGITATAQAAKSQSRLSSLVRTNPDNIGWMILGADNLVDKEFSRTAYAMQKSDGDRVYKSSEEALNAAQAAVGYKQLGAEMQQVADQLVNQRGFNPDTVTTTVEYRAAKKALEEAIKTENPAFANKDAEFRQSFDYYYGQAKRLSSSGSLANRSDMVSFRDYDIARQQVMDHFGIRSFDGTKPQYAQAKAAMYEIGSILAEQDLGFQQQWDRFLQKEVE